MSGRSGHHRRVMSTRFARLGARVPWMIQLARSNPRRLQRRRQPRPRNSSITATPATAALQAPAAATGPVASRKLDYRGTARLWETRALRCLSQMYPLEPQAALEIVCELPRKCRCATIAPVKAAWMIAVAIAFNASRSIMNGCFEGMAFSQCGLPSTNAKGTTKISSPASSLTCRAQSRQSSRLLDAMSDRTRLTACSHASIRSDTDVPRRSTKTPRALEQWK